MKKSLFIILLSLFVVATGFAKTETITVDSYNMRRGNEETEKENYDVALEYYNKELSENPKNAFAHFMIASIQGARNKLSESI